MMLGNVIQESPDGPTVLTVTKEGVAQGDMAKAIEAFADFTPNVAAMTCVPLLRCIQIKDLKIAELAQELESFYRESCRDWPPPWL